MKTKNIITTCTAAIALLTTQSARAADEFAPDREGFIRNWLVLAPIQLESDADGSTGIDKSQVPDEGALKPKAGEKVRVAGKELTWKKVKTTDYILDLNSVVSQQTEKAVGYAVAYIKSEEERSNLQLRMGSNDEGKVYLNGKVLLKTTDPRSLEQDADVAKNVTLNKGTNVLVFKVFNEGGSDWQGCLRFTDAGGKPVTNLMIQLEPANDK